MASRGWLTATACCASVTSWLPAGVGEGVGQGLRAIVQVGVLGANTHGTGVQGVVAAVTAMVGDSVGGSGADCILVYGLWGATHWEEYGVGGL